MKKSVLAAGVCLTAIACVPFFAAAQEDVQNPAGSAEGDAAQDTEVSVRRLDAVVVSAEKRTESILDVGASITAITGDALEYRDLSNAADISSSVPNVEYGEVAGASQITIRGIGLNVETGFAEPAVAVHLNGVYLGRTNSAALGLADLESVEVLRGPQGTLYGRNATGGVVNFNTAQPSDEFEAGVTLGTGSFDRFLARGYVSGPLGEGVRGRLFVDYQEDDGFVDNATTGQTEGGKEATTIKGDLSWDISDSLEADLFYLSLDQEWRGPTFEKIVPGAFAPLAGFDAAPRSVLNNVDPSSDIEMDVAGLTLNWDAGPVAVRSITGYNKFERTDTIDGDVTSLDLLVSGRTEDAEAWSQEFNVFSTTDGDLEWLLGAYWLNEESNARTDVDGGTDAALIMGVPGLSFTLNQLVEDIEAFGLFADVTYNFTDSLRLNVGARYSDEEKTGNQTVTFFGGALALCDGLASTMSFDDTTPRVGVEWDASENTMFYARYQEGFKSGGYNQSGCEAFDPETVESTEIGVKGEYFDGQLRLAASAFNYDYTNLQVLQIRNNVGFVENAADSTIQGVELEARAALTDRLQAEVAVSFLDATYDAFIDGSGNDFSGNTLNRAPEYTALAALEFDAPTASGSIGDLRLRGEVFVSDDVFYRPRNAADDTQESYTLVNVFAALPLADDRYEVRLFGKNITDEDYVVNVISLLDGLDGAFAPPANWGLEFSAKW